MNFNFNCSTLEPWIPADGGGGAEKKPKVEVPEDELRAHLQNGTLGKLTVPVLKDACKQFGIPTTGAKKQDLLDALTSRLGSWQTSYKPACAFKNLFIVAVFY